MVAANVSAVRGSYFEARAKVEGSQGWFGGGADFTLCYLVEEDSRNFLAYYKSICDKYSCTLYGYSKAACDAYFYLPARKEHHGTGAIFFDDKETFQKTEAPNTDAVLVTFVRDVAEGFMPSFLPIANLRRGNGNCFAVEFNLEYNRGLDGGCIESTVVSASSSLVA